MRHLLLSSIISLACGSQSSEPSNEATTGTESAETTNLSAHAPVDPAQLCAALQSAATAWEQGEAIESGYVGAEVLRVAAESGEVSCAAGVPAGDAPESCDLSCSGDVCTSGQLEYWLEEGKVVAIVSHQEGEQSDASELLQMRESCQLLTSVREGTIRVSDAGYTRHEDGEARALTGADAEQAARSDLHLFQSPWLECTTSMCFLSYASNEAELAGALRVTDAEGELVLSSRGPLSSE